MSSAPVPDQVQKLSNIEHGYYSDRWLPQNTTCFWHRQFSDLLPGSTWASCS